MTGSSLPKCGAHSRRNTRDLPVNWFWARQINRLQDLQAESWGAAQVLEEFGVETEVTVVSAHRTPDRMLEYARSAHTRGIQVYL